ARAGSALRDYSSREGTTRAGPGAGHGRALCQCHAVDSHPGYSHRQHGLFRSSPGNCAGGFCFHRCACQVSDSRRGNRMIENVDISLGWAILISILLLIGGGLTFIGCLGLLRLDNFFQRLHAPTLGTTLGAGSVLIASMIFFSVLEARPV